MRAGLTKCQKLIKMDDKEGEKKERGSKTLREKEDKRRKKRLKI